jgi:hypothetical protein
VHCTSSRQRCRVPVATPTSLATNSTAALSGGNNRATARSLNVCPYRANSVLHRHPRVLGSIEATSIVTRGALSEFGIRIALPEMMALANLLHHPAIGETLMGQLFGDRQIKRSNKDLGRVVALAYLADQQDEDALDRWPSRWHEALNEMAPDQAERLAAAAPAGLYALLASAHDIEQALHTVNFGLLSATPLSSTQFVIALRRLVQALVTSRGCRARSAPVRKSQPALDGPTFVRQALARGVH